MRRHSSDVEFFDLDELMEEENTLQPDRRRIEEPEDYPENSRSEETGAVYASSAAHRHVRKAGRKGRKNPKENQGGIPVWIHLLILALIIAAAAFGGYRLYKWNKGSRNEIDPSLQSKFGIEVNDNMVLLPASKLEGHQDDGVTTVLCLGGNPFSDDRSGSGLAGQIQELGEKALGHEVRVLNASFPESQVTCLNEKYDTSSIEGLEDIFNLFYTAYAISLGNYESLETVATLHPDDERYTASIETLKSLDMESVDIIAVMYDSTDYENGMPIANLQYEDELTTYTGAMRNAFKLIQEAYPYIRIVFLSPTYMLHENEDGSVSDGRTTDLGNGTLIQYWQWAFDTCAECSVSFLDNYYGSVNDSNYTEYLSDHMHLNEAGRTKVADHFVYKVLMEEYSEYDANALAVAEE